jgi:hypothetical protein
MYRGKYKQNDTAMMNTGFTQKAIVDARHIICLQVGYGNVSVPDQQKTGAFCTDTYMILMQNGQEIGSEVGSSQFSLFSVYLTIRVKTMGDAYICYAQGTNVYVIMQMLVSSLAYTYVCVSLGVTGFGDLKLSYGVFLCVLARLVTKIWSLQALYLVLG